MGMALATCEWYIQEMFDLSVGSFEVGGRIRNLIQTMAISHNIAKQRVIQLNVRQGSVAGRSSWIDMLAVKTRSAITSHASAFDVRIFEIMIVLL
jgi:hypothetical protein